jgi:putative FmdB family regulatory protein
MPVYEYLCKGCGHEFEREQRISDAPVKKCPACGALKARRQISRTSFVLKGGGWYSDLYGSKPAKLETGESKSAEAKPAEGAADKPAEGAADKPASESPSAAAGGKAEAPPGKGSKKGGKGAKSAA